MMCIEKFAKECTKLLNVMLRRTTCDVRAFSEVMASAGRAGPDRTGLSIHRAGPAIFSPSRWVSLTKTRSVQQRDHLKAK